MAPNDPSANDLLAFIYGLTSQYFQQVPLRLRLMQMDRFVPAHLLFLALGEESLENAEMIEAYHLAQPDDPLPYITLGRIAQEKQDFAIARRHFETAIRLDPQLMAAQVRLGKLLFEQEKWPAFLAWHEKLPPAADGHSGIWLLRGDFAMKHLGDRQAARCYAEALRLDPNHSHSNYQMGQILISLKQSQRAALFLERAKRLRKFINVVKVAYRGEQIAKTQEAVELAETLGLLREAAAWATLLGTQAYPGSATQAWAEQTRSRLRSTLIALPFTRCTPEANPIRAIDVDAFPLPAIPAPSRHQNAREVVHRQSADGKLADREARTADGERRDVAIRFDDQAEPSGLRFRYFNGSESVEHGMEKMYEFAGGGVAILDYDGDGLPDVFFTQGCRWPPKSTPSEFNDRLFRNRGDGRFQDVTLAAGLREADFGQGATVGDFDSDGWPDLFVANIGQNRLYRNNTDGTFTEIAVEAGITGNRWSASAAMVDLNRDGLPDLYVVNYLGDADVFTRVCGNGAKPAICLPQSFHAEQDRLYLNLGDGRFQDVTASAGIVADDGKGLGIIAADLDGTRQLSLFIANDTTPNFFFTNSFDVKTPHKFELTETALVAGLAVNREGKTESGMGVAAGDANEDGRLDLFVANFFGESNTLYQQVSPGVFEDVTLSGGLHQPSLPMVGFGSQFLDADLNGWQDLIVANGHIDDYRDEQTPYYQMPPQFFVNHGDGRFRLADPASLGPYFERKYLGRTVARVDWNRDGREDVVITHLDAPAALLTNTTLQPGGFVALQLRGVQSQRDAIGTVVKATFAGKTRMRQLTAGDGYFCSNERQIVIGLGEAPRIDRLDVEWPSGLREQYIDLPAGSRWLFVEGHKTPYSLPSLQKP